MSQSIVSQDLSLSELFQNFYRVPDYQREYVWGETDAKGERGDEVEQFLRDIHVEYESATSADAPEYFIGTVVVCGGADTIFDLIDGQQRTTTSFLVLCALRDALVELEVDPPSTLAGQIAASVTNWQGETEHRMRLDLQYEDASGILEAYGAGEGPQLTGSETRSIRNLAGAYQTIREFLRSTFADDPKNLQRFHGYFTNKVKLIRIQTPNVGRALKIFETINDRGVGLDAMDLLKNLLFMNASPNDFGKLKEIWKALTQEIYDASEKPLRFLRYFLLANYDVDAKLREEEIYDWLAKNDWQTGHVSDPIGFATELKAAAQIYKRFVGGQNPAGEHENGVRNTRALGGSAIKQHFVLLLAGRRLKPELFSKLASQIEKLMFVWLIAGVAAKDYERVIAQGARALRPVRTAGDYDTFERDFLVKERLRHRTDFTDNLLEMCSWDLRKFRLKYLLAKITQHVDWLAYGEQGRELLGPYLDTQNDVEHILAENADEDAQEEFGEGADDPDWIQSLGNLMWVERSINRSCQNEPYSAKAPKYATSQFLLARCQAEPIKVGANDRITKVVRTLDPASEWSAGRIEQRQAWIADIALDVWDCRLKV